MPGQPFPEIADLGADAGRDVDLCQLLSARYQNLFSRAEPIYKSQLLAAGSQLKSVARGWIEDFYGAAYRLAGKDGRLVGYGIGSRRPFQLHASPLNLNQRLAYLLWQTSLVHLRPYARGNRDCKATGIGRPSHVPDRARSAMKERRITTVGIDYKQFACVDYGG